MDALGIIAIILAVIGIAGGFLPIVPGPPLSWVALLLVYFSESAKDELSVSALVIWLVIAVVITILDYVLPGIFTKVTGGHKAAEKGAIIGLIVGLLFTPVGMILGSFLGAFLGELLFEKQDVSASLKAASGAFIAFILTTGIKVIFSVILLWQVLAHLFGTPSKPKVDYTEYFCGYDDRISFIVEGYQSHWDGFSPEDLELSNIYKYESPYGGFAKTDLDGDGTEELLLGDQFENGDYQIYDIFTFDKTTGDIIHLFCGGERNWCTFNGSGVIIETGSNSADDSFTKYYVIKNLKLKKLGRNQPVTKDIFIPNLDKFINYAQP